MKVLDLPLKKEWYEMIESSVKKEEYREIKPYWTKRFEKNEYTHIRFRYGYTKRTMMFELADLSKGVGNKDWGAPDYDVYILVLGNRMLGDEKLKKCIYELGFIDKPNQKLYRFHGTEQFHCLVKPNTTLEIVYNIIKNEFEIKATNNFYSKKNNCFITESNAKVMLETYNVNPFNVYISKQLEELEKEVN